MRTIIVILVVLLVVLQVQVWRQYGRVAELEQRVESQRLENGDLAARNAALAAEVDDLQSGLEAVEERARAELGLIRDGEAFYLVVEPDDLDPEDAEALRRAGESATASEPEEDTGTGPRADSSADG